MKNPTLEERPELLEAGNIVEHEGNFLLEVGEHEVVGHFVGELEVEVEVEDGGVAEVEEEGLGVGGDPEQVGDVVVSEHHYLFHAPLPPDAHGGAEDEARVEGVEGNRARGFEKLFYYLQA